MVKNMKSGAQTEYTIVGTMESDPTRGFISNESPVGSALLGARNNDVLEVKVPREIMKLQVVKIYQKQHTDVTE